MRIIHSLFKLKMLGPKTRRERNHDSLLKRLQASFSFQERAAGSEVRVVNRIHTPCPNVRRSMPECASCNSRIIRRHYVPYMKARVHVPTRNRQLVRCRKLDVNGGARVATQECCSRDLLIARLASTAIAQLKLIVFALGLLTTRHQSGARR